VAAGKGDLMLQPMTNGRTTYEVGLYNRDVRAAVKGNESHFFFGDHWADLQVQDVLAQNEEEARELISKKYPPEEGFVVQHLTALGY